MKWTALLNDYTQYLQIERGLSANTIDSYRRDVTKLIKYLQENNINISPENIDKDTLLQFIYEVAKKKQS